MGERVGDEELAKWEIWCALGRFGAHGFVVSNLLSEVSFLAARLAEAEGKLVNVKTAADDALDELVKCPDYETAMVVASKLCGTLQFISGYTALAAALAPGAGDGEEG